MTQTYQYHPYCLLIPPAREAEFEELKADIQKHGLQNPGVLYQEKILDGRNRYEACLAVNMPFSTTNFTGDDEAALAFVFSANLYRRMLSDSQRAQLVAAIPGLTNQVKAGLANVSLRHLNQANQIQREGIPELREAVLDGKIGLKNAVEVSKHPAKTQRMVIPDLRDGAIKKLLMKIRHGGTESLPFQTELLKVNAKWPMPNSQAYRTLLAKVQYLLTQFERLPEMLKQLKKSAADIEQLYVLSQLRAQLLPYIKELRKFPSGTLGVETAKILWDDILRQINQQTVDVFCTVPQSQYGKSSDVVLRLFGRLMDDLENVIDTIGSSPIEF